MSFTFYYEYEGKMLKHASVYITLIVAILYTLGLNYYQGFLGGFGLEEAMFPLTLDQTIFAGYISMVHIGLKPILWLLVATEVALFVVFLVGYLLSRLEKEKTSDSDATKTPTESNGKSRFVIGAERFFTYAVVVFLVFLGAILISLTSIKAGKASAEKHIEKIKDGKVDSKLIILREGGKQLKGYSIVSSPQLCAFMIDDKPTVFNMVDIKMIVSNQDKKESKK